MTRELTWSDFDWTPDEVAKRFAECNELSDAYAEQNATIKELRAEIERLRTAHDDYVVAANANVCALYREIERLKAWAENEQRGRHKAEEDRMNARSEIARLKAAARDAHKLIDNELVGPWVAAHKLDDVLLGDPKS